MIDSKRILSAKVLPEIYIFLSLRLSAQLSASRVGLAGVFTANVPLRKYLFLFCCCAEVSKSVVVHLAAALPLATRRPQRTAEEHRVYPLHQAGTGALPLMVSPHRHPGNRNLISGKPRGPGFQHMLPCASGLAGQLSGIAAAADIAALLLFAICHLAPSTLRTAGPAARIFFYMNYLLAVCFPFDANQLAA
jgi:hypothetical protein